MNKIPRPGPVSKIGQVAGPSPVATPPVPATSPAQAADKIQISTFITGATGKTDILYNADRAWARVTLTLTTAGPVAVSQLESIQSLTGGTGMLLQTGVPAYLDVPRGNRIYVLATAVNRINVVVAPIPWLEVITGCVMAIAGRMGAILNRP